jgi:hypothetical protein
VSGLSRRSVDLRRGSAIEDAGEAVDPFRIERVEPGWRAAVRRGMTFTMSG